MPLSTSSLAPVVVLCCIPPSHVERPFPNADTPAPDSAPVDMLRFRITPVTLTVSLAHLASCWWQSSACAKSQRCRTCLATRATRLVAKSADGAWSVVCIPATSLATLASVLSPRNHALSPVQRLARAAVTDAELPAMDKNPAQKISLARSLFLRVASAATSAWSLLAMPQPRTLGMESPGLSSVTIIA